MVESVGEFILFNIIGSLLHLLAFIFFFLERRRRTALHYIKKEMGCWLGCFSLRSLVVLIYNRQFNHLLASGCVCVGGGGDLSV
jgi:hypothetical protein